MYEHYERHRTDNITDPALRRAHPISTISGWDRDRDEPNDNSTTNNNNNNNNNNQISNCGAITAAQTNGPQIVTEKVSKSEQTDDTDNVVLENVKCVCEENANDADTTSHTETIGQITNTNGMTMTSSSTTAATTITQTQTAALPTTTSGDELQSPPTNESTSTPSSKPVSSISSISQVYNEQLTGQSVVCNGNTQHLDDESSSTSSPIKQTENANGTTTSGSEALRKALEIDSYDANTEDNKEIVEEIVEEILKKSENLLDDCKRSLNEHLDDTETTSPVIKDEEIEHAVSEVVKGVRNIEKMVKRTDTDSNTVVNSVNTNEKINDDVNDSLGEQQQIPTISTIEKTCQTQQNDNNQKTDLPLSSADDKVVIGDDIDEVDIDDDVAPVETSDPTIASSNVEQQQQTSATSEADAEEIKQIVTNIVNDVIENCVNDEAPATTTTPTTTQTTTTIKTDDTVEICDNDMNETSIAQQNINVDNINNNSSDVSIKNSINNNNQSVNDNNDNAIIDDTIMPATIQTQAVDVVNTVLSAAVNATISVEETNEEIIKGIVSEIVDKCVENETNTKDAEAVAAAAAAAAAADDDNKNNNSNEKPIGNESGNEVPTANDAKLNALKTENNAGIQINRSISTSTQVENNHFGMNNLLLANNKILFLFWSSFSL